MDRKNIVGDDIQLICMMVKELMEELKLLFPVEQRQKQIYSHSDTPTIPFVFFAFWVCES
jgi:hypothetical protein